MLSNLVQLVSTAEGPSWFIQNMVNRKIAMSAYIQKMLNLGFLWVLFLSAIVMYR